MINQKGFSVVEGLAVIAILAVVGFAGFTVLNNSSDDSSTDDAVTNETAQETSGDQVESDSQQEVAVIPDGWIKYVNDEFGFSFAYPSEWGETIVGEPNLGTEQQAGPRIAITFTDCDECNSDIGFSLGANTPEVALNSRDFGGIGSGRPLTLESGYTDNGDDSFTVYGSANNEFTYTQDNTIELGLVNDVLVIRQNDEMHNIDTTRAVVNVADDEYSALSFIIHDTIGESSNANLLRSIVETIELL